jgi:hypothetical protein
MECTTSTPCGGLGIFQRASQVLELPREDGGLGGAPSG